VRKLPEELRWLFWDVDPEALDLDAHEATILARVLEAGRLSDVRAALELYGEGRVHTFFREVGHPEISDPTRHFWRAFFHAEDERWASPPDWRKNTSAPWID
jgi:hypothetical protein